MAESVNIHEAKTQLSKLVAKAAAGGEVIIVKGGKPVARLVPLAPTRIRKLGALKGKLKGKLKIPRDFDARLPVEVLVD